MKARRAKNRRLGRQKAPLGPLGNPAALVGRWRAEADVLRAHGAVEAAVTKERDAAELAEWAKAHALQLLTLQEAARESGYSYSALQIG